MAIKTESATRKGKSRWVWAWCWTAARRRVTMMRSIFSQNPALPRRNLGRRAGRDFPGLRRPSTAIITTSPTQVSIRYNACVWCAAWHICCMPPLL